MALKQCFKQHKLFVSEIERCDRIDREGAQVLSSLANVAARVPSLTATAAAWGVLAYVAGTPTLLLEKHFVAMEKSASLLREIVRDGADTVRRVRTFVDEMAAIVDDVVATEDAVAATRAAMETLEWMENVAAMYEREALRKRLLVVDVEYHDVPRLQRMHREWSASAATSYVDQSYVRRGVEVLPPVMQRETSGTTGSTEPSSSKKKKKTKPKA